MSFPALILLILEVPVGLLGGSALCLEPLRIGPQALIVGLLPRILCPKYPLRCSVFGAKIDNEFIVRGLSIRPLSCVIRERGNFCSEICPNFEG